MPSLIPTVSLYDRFVRPALFRLDAEDAHRLTLWACAAAGSLPGARGAVRRSFGFEDERLATSLGTVALANPLGLAAGFDKNARALSVLGSTGFGHVEIGSVSAYPSRGNRRPRLFRLPDDGGIVVNYGVPNDGSAVVGDRLASAARPAGVAVGVNLVKTNDPLRPAVEPDVYDDYVIGFRTLAPLADYVMVNLSCPNSPGDRDFFDSEEHLHALLARLAELDPALPVLLKIKPLGDVGALRATVEVADEFPFVTGFAPNFAPRDPAGLALSMPRPRLATMPGAFAGDPIREAADQLLGDLARITRDKGKGRYLLVAAGGVSSAEHAYRKLRLGASVVQIYSGLVYRGPGLVREILTGLVRLLDRDGLGSVGDAVGLDVD